MKNILHVIPDDKFSSNTIEFYSSLDFILNDFITVKRTPFLYLNKNSIESLPIFSSGLRKRINHSKYDAIILHSLSIKTLLLIIFVTKKTNIIWRTYGQDLYSLVYNQKRIHKPLTYEYIINNDKFNFFKRILKEHLYRILFRIASNKIRYISCHLDEEFVLLKEKYNIKATKIFLPIGFLPVSKNINIVSNGNNLLIGQSATLWNNHLDIFPLINSNINFFEYIICPLSYPQLSNANYKKKIIADATLQFKDKFIPLVNYLPEEEYNKILCSFKAAIFYHERQAALANIMICLYLGINVFMSKTNCLYSYLLSIGLNIFTFPDEFISENINFKISEEELKRQRNILHSEIWLTYNDTYTSVKYFFEKVFESAYIE